MEVGRGPICLRQRDRRPLHIRRLGIFYGNRSMAAGKHSLKSNLSPFPQHRASREDRAVHVHRVWPQAFSCCHVSLLPHLLITDIEVKVHTNGYECTRVGTNIHTGAHYLPCS